MPRTLNEPIYLSVCLTLPSYHTSTSELSGRLWTRFTSGLFLVLSASATWFSARIFHILFIALSIAATLYTILGECESIICIYR